MGLHVFEVGEYGVVAPNGESALEILRENEGDDVADWLIECRVWPTQLDDTSKRGIDWGTSDNDDDSEHIVKTCAEWITSYPHIEILWRPA